MDLKSVNTAGSVMFASLVVFMLFMILWAIKAPSEKGWASQVGVDSDQNHHQVKSCIRGECTHHHPHPGHHRHHSDKNKQEQNNF